jgi:hypothetical protein
MPELEQAALLAVGVDAKETLAAEVLIAATGRRAIELMRLMQFDLLVVGPNDPAMATVGADERSAHAPGRSDGAVARRDWDLQREDRLAGAAARRGIHPAANGRGGACGTTFGCRTGAFTWTADQRELCAGDVNACESKEGLSSARCGSRGRNLWLRSKREWQETGDADLRRGGATDSK